MAEVPQKVGGERTDTVAAGDVPGLAQLRCPFCGIGYDFVIDVEIIGREDTIHYCRNCLNSWESIPKTFTVKMRHYIGGENKGEILLKVHDSIIFLDEFGNEKERFTVEAIE